MRDELEGEDQERMRQARTVGELYDLTGRVALVTGGAGGGYGRQVVQALSEAGATVVLTSRSAGRAAAAADSLVSRTRRVEGAVLELRSEESIRNLCDSISRRHGRIDILVNSAAHNILRPIDTMSIREWDDILAVNLRGTWLMCRSVAPLMRSQGSGVIINISSIYGSVAPDPSIYADSGLDSPLAYGVSKSGIIQLTRYLAVYWAPEIRVNCISPGGLYAQQEPGFVARYEQKTPLGRMAGQEDLKGTVLYLASDASGWVTGQNLLVDGGWTAW